MANNAIEIAAKYVLKLLNDDSEMKGWTPIDSVSIERKRDDTVLFFSNVDGDFVAHKLTGGNLVRPYFQKLDFSIESQIVPQIKVLMKYHAPLPDSATPAQRLMEAAMHLISMRATNYG